MANFSVLSWENAAEILNESLGFQLKEVSKLAISKTPFVHSQEFGDWELLSDEDLFDKIITEGNKYFDVTGSVFATTDVSYLKADGVFVFDLELSGVFFKWYFERFGECFFNGDVFLFIPEANRLALFQHDGFLLFYETPIEFF